MRELPAGSLLVSSREQARDLCLLARGDAALGTAPDDGPFQPERSLQGPAWIDASSAWLGGTPAQDAMALSDVQVVTLPRAEVQSLLQRYPELGRRIVVTLAQQVHSLTMATHELMHKDADGALCRLAAAALRQRAASDGTITVCAARAQARHRVATRHHARDLVAPDAQLQPQGRDRGRGLHRAGARPRRRCAGSPRPERAAERARRRHSPPAAAAPPRRRAITSGSLPAMPGTPIGQVMRAIASAAMPRCSKRWRKRARLVFEPIRPR